MKLSVATFFAVCLWASAAVAQAPVSGVGPYQFGMSPEAVRAALPRARFFERFFEAGPPLYGSGTLTLGPPEYLLDRNFAVVVKFSEQRRLYGVQLMHFDWVRTREQCAGWHRAHVADFAARHGPFRDAAPAPAIERITNGEVTGIYVGVAVEYPSRDTLIEPQTITLPDGSLVQAYRAVRQAPDLRAVESDWGADQVFASLLAQNEAGAPAREISVSTRVRPLSRGDEPTGSYRFNCTLTLALRDLTVEARVR